MLHPAAPAYTIQGKKSFIDKLNDGYEDCSPGPVYNTTGMGIKTRAVSFTTGKGSRTNINEGVLNNPSPTHYENTLKQKGKSNLFGKSRRVDQQTKNLNPQAAIYQPNQNFVKTTYPNFSMGSKYPSIMDDTGKNPGPGYYQTGKQMITTSTKDKTTKFGYQKRFSEPLVRPGVGQYEINPEMKEHGSNQGTIGQADRFPVGPNYPGPGAYKPKSDFSYNDKNPKGKTLASKLQGCFTLQSQTRNSFGIYAVEQNLNLKKTFSFGKEKRQIFKAEDIPGPGDYRAEKPMKKTSRAFINTGKYVDYDTSRENPGPGHYQSPNKKSTIYSFGKSKSMKVLSTHPGVGRYQMDKGMSKTGYQSWSVGKSKRTNFVSKNIAGVGDYQILQKKTGGISIPRASRFPKPNDNPGPGDYQFQSTISNFNFYKKRGKTSQQTQQSTH